LAKPLSTAKTLRCKGSGELYSAAELRASAHNPWLLKAEGVRLVGAGGYATNHQNPGKAVGWKSPEALTLSFRKTAFGRVKKMSTEARVVWAAKVAQVKGGA
jgi:hypothetical protein